MREFLKRTRKAFAIHCVMPRFKYWKEEDNNNAFQFYYSDKVMRLLTKSVCGLHIEWGNKHKILIHLPYVV